ncbi:hypothetical protein AK88_03080 [Plasmodium fragile]|uniref:K Homology domain-containing protein n=1 Tax=Plasmodium fragile TaxID=5857 RepID=A0A0D9QK03_PLAFR|nr:uncharacterized protein AK88_03080 [Plasmodium fragile]KJP87283.1 hypothetical protein AK88_03080 [Plasmodium fragile]
MKNMNLDYQSEQTNVPPVAPEGDLNNLPLKGSDKDKKDNKHKTEKKDQKEKKEKGKTKSKTVNQQMENENAHLYNSQGGILSSQGNCKFISSDASRMTNELSKSADLDSTYAYRYNMCATTASSNNESNKENLVLHDVADDKNNFLHPTVCNVEGTIGVTPFSEACIFPHINNTMEPPGFAHLNKSHGGRNNMVDDITDAANVGSIISDCYSGGVNRRDNAIIAGDNSKYDECGELYSSTGGANRTWNYVSGVNSMHNLNSANSPSEHPHSGLNSCAGSVYDGVSTTSSNVKSSSWKSAAHMRNTNMLGLTIGEQISIVNSAPMKGGSSRKKTKGADDLADREVSMQPEEIFANLNRLNVDEMGTHDDVMKEKNAMDLFHYENFSLDNGMYNLMGRNMDHQGKSVSENCGTITTTMPAMMDGTSNSPNGNHNVMKNNVGITESRNIVTPPGDDLALAEVMRHNRNYEDYTKMSSTFKSNPTSDLEKYMPGLVSSNGKENGKGSFYNSFLSNANEGDKLFNGDDSECASIYMAKDNVEDRHDSSGVYVNVGSDNGVHDEKNFKTKNLIKEQILNYARHAQHANHLQHGIRAVQSNHVSYNQSKLHTSKMAFPIMGQERKVKKNQSEDLKFINKDRFFFRNGDSLFKGDVDDEFAALINKNFKGKNACAEKSVHSVKPAYMTTDSTIYTANNAVSKNKNGGQEDDDEEENGHYCDNENGDDLSRRCGDGVTGPFNFENEVHKNCESVIGPYNYDEEMHINYEDRLHLNYDDDLFSRNTLHLNVKDDDIGNASYFEKSSDFEDNVAQLQKDLDFSVNLSSINNNMSFLNFDDSEEKDWKYEQMHDIFSTKGDVHVGNDDHHSLHAKGTLTNSFPFNDDNSSSGYNLGGGRNFGLNACNTVFASPAYSEPRNFDDKSIFNPAVESSNQCNNGVKKNVMNNNMLFVNNSNLNMNWRNAHSVIREKCTNEESTYGRNNDTINSNLIIEEHNACNNEHTLMDDNHLGMTHNDHSLENNTTSLANNKKVLHSGCVNTTCASVSESIPAFTLSKSKGAHRRSDHLNDEVDSALHSDGEHMEKEHSRSTYSNAITKNGGELVGIKSRTVHSSGLSRKGSMNKEGVTDSTLEDNAKRGGSNAKRNEETNPAEHITGDVTVESVIGKCGKNSNNGSSNNKNSVKGVGMVQNSRSRESATDSRSVRKMNTNDQSINISGMENVQLKNASNFSNDSTNSTSSSRSRSDGSNRSGRSGRSNRSNRSGRNDPVESNGQNQKSINPVASELNKTSSQNNGFMNAEYKNKMISPEYNTEPLSYEHIKNDKHSFKNEMVRNNKSRSSAFLNFASTNFARTNSNEHTSNVFMNGLYNLYGRGRSHVRKYFQSGLNDGNRSARSSKYGSNNLMINRNSLDSYTGGNDLNSTKAAMNLNRTFLNQSNCNNRVYRASNEKKKKESFLPITNSPLGNAQRINLLTAEKGKNDMVDSPLLSFNKQNVRGSYPLKDDHLGPINTSMSSKAKDDIFHLNDTVENFGVNNQSAMYNHPMDPGENVYSCMSDQKVYYDMNKQQNGLYKNGTNVEKLVFKMNDPNGRCFYGNVKNVHGDEKAANVNLIGKNEYLFRNIKEDMYNEVKHVQESELKYGPLSGAQRNGASIGVDMIPPGVGPAKCPPNNANICDNLVESDHLKNLTDSMSRFENDVEFILDENENFEGDSKATLKNDKIIQLQNIINSLKFKNKQLEKELTEVKNMQLKKKQSLILNSLSNKNDDISSYSTYKDDTNNSDCGSADNSNRYVQNFLNDKEKYNYDTKISIQKFHLAYTNNSIGKLKIAAQRDISGSFMGPKGIHVKTIKSSLHISVYKSAKDVWFPGFADSHVFLLKGNIFGILRACQLLYHYVKSKMSSSKCCIYLVAPFECVQKLLADGCKRMAIIKEECGADVRLGNLYVQVHEGFTERLMEIRGNEVNVDCALEKLVIFMQSCFSVQSYDYELLKYPCRSVLNLQ